MQIRFEGLFGDSHFSVFDHLLQFGFIREYNFSCRSSALPEHKIISGPESVAKTISWNRLGGARKIMSFRPYHGTIPPCGVFCGTCPRYLNKKRPCPGAEIHCTTRKCKSVYVCCIEKKQLSHCHECSAFPCYKLKKFAANWLSLGQDLLQNQQLLREHGEPKWLERFNTGNPPEKD